MEIWEAALIVLYETPPEQWRGYKSIAREILDRRLYYTDNRRFYQSVGEALRYRGRGHFEHRGGRTGDYRLSNHAGSMYMYEWIKEREPWRFPTQQSSMPASAGPTAEPKETAASQPPRTSRPVAKKTRRQQAGEKPTGTPNSKPTGQKRPARTRSQKLIVIAEQLIAEEVPVFIEGATKRICINAHERDQEARRRCIARHGLKCDVCRMRFDDEYGPIGEGFIHVHHLKPLKHGRQEVDPEDDLRPVCPNCHAMLHKGDRIQGKPFSIKELKEKRLRAKRRARDSKRRANLRRTRNLAERSPRRRRSRAGKT